MSRKVYDACRRYKHFYKKHEDVKGWNNKYYDIDLTQAVAKSKAQLDDVSKELLMALFDEYEVFCTNMETSYDVSITPMGVFGSGLPPIDSLRTSHTDVEFQDSRRFLNVLAEYLMIKSRW